MASLADLLNPPPSPELLARLNALDALPDDVQMLLDDLAGVHANLDQLPGLAARLDALAATVARLDAQLNPPPVPPPPPATQPSGFALPTANLPGFTLRYIEDFGRPVPEGPVNDTGAKAPFDLLYGVEAHNDLPGGVPITIGTYPSPWDDTSNRGHYGAAIVSVTPGSSVARVHTRTEKGWPRVHAMYPRIGPLIGSPYGSRDVLGGAFELAWNCQNVQGRKFVPLLWAQGDHRQTPTGVGADGEIDWPEFNCFGLAKILGYVHWQGDVSTDTVTEQTRVLTDKVGADGKWHVTRTEHIPGKQSAAHPTRSIGGSVKLYLDDLLVGTVTGSKDGVTGPFIPETPMHWVLQYETSIGGPAIDPLAEGDLLIDWMAYYSLDGITP